MNKQKHWSDGFAEDIWKRGVEQATTKHREAFPRSHERYHYQESFDIINKMMKKIQFRCANKDDFCAKLQAVMKNPDINMWMKERPSAAIEDGVSVGTPPHIDLSPLVTAETTFSADPEPQESNESPTHDPVMQDVEADTDPLFDNLTSSVYVNYESLCKGKPFMINVANIISSGENIEEKVADLIDNTFKNATLKQEQSYQLAERNILEDVEKLENYKREIAALERKIMCKKRKLEQVNNENNVTGKDTHENYKKIKLDHIKNFLAGF